MDVNKNDFLSTPLINEVVKCRKGLSELISMIRVNKSSTKLVDGFCTMWFNKPDSCIFLKGGKRRSRRWFANFMDKRTLRYYYV